MFQRKGSVGSAFNLHTFICQKVQLSRSILKSLYLPVDDSVTCILRFHSANAYHIVYRTTVKFSRNKNTGLTTVNVACFVNIAFLNIKKLMEKLRAG